MDSAHTGAMLKARHAAERLQGAWHGGVSSIDQLRARMQDTLAEFATSADEAEVGLMPPPGKASASSVIVASEPTSPPPPTMPRWTSCHLQKTLASSVVVTSESPYPHLRRRRRGGLSAFSTRLQPVRSSLLPISWRSCNRRWTQLRRTVVTILVFRACAMKQRCGQFAVAAACVMRPRRCTSPVLE